MKRTATTFAFFGFTIFCLAGFSCSRKEQVPMLSKPVVSQIAIYYVNWNIDAFKGMTCDDLVSSPSHVEIRDSAQVREFVSALKGVMLVEEVGYKSLDVRVCCILEDSAGNPLVSVSFSPTSQMQIDQKVYKTDPKLFQLVLGYLPKDYLKT
jgi:hypothetical protein